MWAVAGTDSKNKEALAHEDDVKNDTDLASAKQDGQSRCVLKVNVNKQIANLLIWIISISVWNGIINKTEMTSKTWFYPFKGAGSNKRTWWCQQNYKVI